MNIEALRDYCLSLPETTEELPFDNNTLVFKVAGKMFLATSLNEYDGFNVKCDPAKAIELREKFSSVEAGYHMNKKHWNTIKLTGELNEKQLKHWILHSYELVVAKLPKTKRDKINQLRHE